MFDSTDAVLAAIIAEAIEPYVRSAHPDVTDAAARDAAARAAVRELDRLATEPAPARHRIVPPEQARVLASLERESAWYAEHPRVPADDRQTCDGCGERTDDVVLGLCAACRSYCYVQTTGNHLPVRDDSTATTFCGACGMVIP